MHKKLWSLLALGLALVLVAANCGNDDDSAPDMPEATAMPEATEMPEATAMPEATEMSEATAMPAPKMPSEALITLEEECEAWGGIQAPADFRVNMVTDIGKVDDGTFNQFAYEGMIAATECFGIEDSSVIETASEADYDANLTTSALQDPDVLITVGFLLASHTLEAAEDNPDIHYIGIDQFQMEYPDNYLGVLFNEHEGGFIAGALAASLSETGVVGVIGGLESVPPVVKFVNGYKAGAEHINPDIQVLSVYNESFTDPAKGASDAQQFIGEGADVIFGAGGPTGSGGVKAAAEAGAWGIGVDQDEYYTTFNGGTAPGSEYLASSAIKRVDLSVFRNIAAVIQGTFAGGSYVLTAENLGITYAPFHDAAVSAEAAATVERVRAGLADGSLTTGVCGIDGLFLGENSACD
ncbi:BMP family ABC transporter substrate-binding protein [Candidatus Poriferisocius sp.]|uniref:BMP family ABC transporter substrate-binding protein n=1 Tax=Candidatus Poriferisocius sp. TaxID=3101276 RepID=UPI003B01C6F0